MGIGVYLADQTVFFLQSILLGIGFGLLYDLLRVTRLAVPTPSVVVFVEDVLYFLVCAVATFFFLMRTIDGQVRFFLLIGGGLGGLGYFLALSKPVMKVGEKLTDWIKGILWWLFRHLIHPIWRLLRWILRQIIRPLAYLGRFFKKSAQRCKYRLKVRRKVLYNQLKGAAGSGKRKSQPNRKKRKTRKDGRQKEKS